MKKEAETSVLQRMLRMVVTSRVPGGCRTPGDCPSANALRGVESVRQTLSDVDAQKGVCSGGRVSHVDFGLATLHDRVGVTAGTKHRNEPLSLSFCRRPQ